MTRRLPPSDRMLDIEAGPGNRLAHDACAAGWHDDAIDRDGAALLFDEEHDADIPAAGIFDARVCAVNIGDPVSINERSVARLERGHNFPRTLQWEYLTTPPRNCALKQGHHAFGSDLVNRGWDSTKTPHDFLSDAETQYDNIVCNPPFNIADLFALNAFIVARRKVALVFPVARLNAAHWLKTLPLRRVWLMTPRPSMPPGYTILAGEKPGGGKMDYCWLVIEHGYFGVPELRWLRRDGDDK